MIAVVLVTHNSTPFLAELLTSIDQQTQKPDIKIAIDDHSTDNTTDLLETSGFTVRTSEESRTQESNTTTRIARNFVQGVKAAQGLGAEFVILGDHDDVWHPHRIAHQVKELKNRGSVSMLASNGRTPMGTLRTTFPVPENFNDVSQGDQWRYAAKHSVATGGASALAPDRLSTLDVPPGWLHDRWWSLRAVREGSLWIDPEIVIDYRVSSQQQVGLDTGGQHNPLTWAWAKVRHLPTTVAKMKDIAKLLDETKAN